jgi:hypothetical protein
MAGFLPRQRKHGDPADADTNAAHAKTLAFRRIRSFQEPQPTVCAARANTATLGKCACNVRRTMMIGTIMSLGGNTPQIRTGMFRNLPG